MEEGKETLVGVNEIWKLYSIAPITMQKSVHQPYTMYKEQCLADRNVSSVT
jgi:hypothetical protein